MLTLLRRMMRKDDHPLRAPDSPEARHRCRESEFCFFNHAATFAFDQVNECESTTPPRKETYMERTPSDEGSNGRRPT